MLARKIYYSIKPFVPREFQIFLRRKMVALKRPSCADIWPIDHTAYKPPEGWSGWPNGKQFALVLTHDVDTAKGHDRACDLMNLERKLGFRSAFNFVPERYNTSPELRRHLVQNGFEVGVHGLKHDGRLYVSKRIFRQRAVRINHYLKEWKAVGFRSPSMHHNLDWIHDLNIEYDCSSFDTDPFESQPDGVATIFPFWVVGNSTKRGYVEIPCTIPQDFNLFILMKEPNINIWKQKLDWIAEKGGMALLNTHPDYMNFDGANLTIEEYPAGHYLQFLNYIKDTYSETYCHVLPGNMARFWSKNYVSDYLVNEKFAGVMQE